MGTSLAGRYRRAFYDECTLNNWILKDGNMNRIFTYGCLLSIFFVVGCTSNDDDGGGSVTTSAASDLQGAWAGPCEFDEDGDPSLREFTFSGSNVTTSDIRFFNSTTCDGNLTIVTDIIAAFSIDGTQTSLVDGTANNIDLVLSGATITGSAELTALLESQGTTLAALVAAEGLTGDINNLSIEELGIDQAEFFDIFRIDASADGTDRLIFGDTDDSFTGNTPALRPISLDTNEFYLRVL